MNAWLESPAHHRASSFGLGFSDASQRVYLKRNRIAEREAFDSTSRFVVSLVSSRSVAAAPAGGEGGTAEMRDLHLQQLRLNQTQRVRLQTALQKLQDVSPSSAAATVAVADNIPVNHEDGVLKGHGTSELDGQVVATLCGVVERVNKLVYVRTLRARYKPEIGDIIVGRVIEVATKHWRLEINFSQDAVLMLSSMNLPDGIQRRRTATDELNMRSIFEENDVICAEVRGFQHDGSLHLQARSLKYGKLKSGQLLTVPPYLIKRRKQHFHYLENYGVDLILGCNGFIWIGEHVETSNGVMEGDGGNKVEESNESSSHSVPLGEKGQRLMSLETRQHICQIANAVRVLSTLGFSLTTEGILEAAKASISLGINTKDMLGLNSMSRLQRGRLAAGCHYSERKGDLYQLLLT